MEVGWSNRKARHSVEGEPTQEKGSAGYPRKLYKAVKVPCGLAHVVNGETGSYEKLLLFSDTLTAVGDA